ncbi:MAG: hypothetical protein HYZ28_10975 [Myxococcales bacterium]|nr:hypothetical protein [Myxococcales bacterium]
MKRTVAFLLAPLSALAGERVVQLRSIEDASSPPDPAVCAAAPFRVNLRLGASLWAIRTRASDGQVVNDSVQKVGTATACGRITNFAFPPGLQQDFMVKFDLPDGSYTGVGTCTLVSNNVPKPGVVLAGCNLKLSSAPSGVVGGAATSASVFNPFRLTGFSTGSYWTLLLYDTSVGPGDGQEHKDHPHDLEVVEDRRSEEEIAGKAAEAAR